MAANVDVRWMWMAAAMAYYKDVSPACLERLEKTTKYFSQNQWYTNNTPTTTFSNTIITKLCSDAQIIHPYIKLQIFSLLIELTNICCRSHRNGKSYAVTVKYH
jgi:hypothetical protein